MSLNIRFKNLFSQPESKQTLGLCLQQHSLTYCAVSEVDPYHCDKIEVSNGLYLDSLASLQNKQQLSGGCHLILSSKQNQIVQLDKPSVPDTEINAALKWQIKDLVTIAPEDMIVDYFDGPKLAGGGEKINVVCAVKSELQPYVEQLNKSELTIKSITIEEFAFASLLPVQDDACLMICQQPNEDMLLIIVKQGKLYFQRRLRGMAQIAQKNEDELNMGTIDSLSLEIQRSTDYFERQLKQAPIRSIEILVPMKNEAFLARKLSENTNVSVNIFSMPEPFSEQRVYAACIGATMLDNKGAVE